ncbi:MAG: hypothetical protein WBZ01_12585 [Terriglobales bacterium]|jgi:hypothetical protein
MPRSFAINNKCFPTAAKVALSLMGALLIALALPATLQAQGPALTTISEMAEIAGEVRRELRV